MPNPVVSCNVSNCVHWVPRGVCGAETIVVSPPRAHTEEDTACHTFASRGELRNWVMSLSNAELMGAAMEVALPGQQLSPDVRCTVRACRFWAHGDLCQAETVQITGSRAQTVDATDCVTFMPRG